MNLCKNTRFININLKGSLWYNLEKLLKLNKALTSSLFLKMKKIVPLNCNLV